MMCQIMRGKREREREREREKEKDNIAINCEQYVSHNGGAVFEIFYNGTNRTSFSEHNCALVDEYALKKDTNVHAMFHKHDLFALFR